MKRKTEIFRCKLEGCNRELPYRYKGAQRQFCDAECRKKYHASRKKRG